MDIRFEDSEIELLFSTGKSAKYKSAPDVVLKNLVFAFSVFMYSSEYRDISGSPILSIENCADRLLTDLDMGWFLEFFVDDNHSMISPSPTVVVIGLSQKGDNDEN